MTIIETPRFILRPCRESDRELFYELSSDPDVLEFFPFRRSREDADAVFDMISGQTPEDGFDLLVLTLKQSGKPIGLSGLSGPKLEPFLPENAVEIGWRLSAGNWRQGYASEAGAALLRHGFETLKLDEIVSIAVHNNHRALAVMQRIGMRPDPAGAFDHPDIPATHPQLKRHALYRLSAAEWRQRQMQATER
ncbi:MULTISPECIES: GNAT family N-acetyltransferase [unclassified Rhizobium]|uniref:GNAT family N-acetyltransferase n=1 Tax=unclassified Rhizobium TaxID=2613769 RepID=UPI000CDF55B1|nr:MULTISPECIES: GNAT family N-acetyltransferase [Rhizobium]AVA22052.1 GCN5-related N-acetyltransferase protein [Rhizobium sp. NXC24]MDK4737924.1 GNAT family N-acetyltransferase [Rhizobium sp. CNPSo 3464]UWU23107.1 GNAT family N-acetyltransferase [Rhizobium tropici]